MSITRIYLGANTLIYLIFSAWCLYDPAGTAAFSGLSFLNGSGKAEYLTIYSGLEAGLGLYYGYSFFAASARRPALIFSAFLYSGILLTRLPAILFIPGIKSATFAVAGLETVLTATAFICLLRKEEN
jgi:hypothetical protein